MKYEIYEFNDDIYLKSFSKKEHRKIRILIIPEILELLFIRK